MNRTVADGNLGRRRPANSAKSERTGWLNQEPCPIFGKSGVSSNPGHEESLRLTTMKNGYFGCLTVANAGIASKNRVFL